MDHPDKARATGYLYPWDVIDDPAASDRLAGLRVDSIALAAAYHGVRAVTPFHPRHRFVEAEHSALYVPVRPASWASSPIQTASAQSWTGHPDSFGLAKSRLLEVGLSVDAWVVLCHRDPGPRDLAGDGAADSAEFCVRNAFGDRYRYALCPSQPAVVDYTHRLVAEVLELGRPDGLVVEACGPLGIGHGHLHDKSAMEGMSVLEEALLSLCFCPACAVSLTDLGVDAARSADRVRHAVRELSASHEPNSFYRSRESHEGSDGSATPVEDALGPEAAALHAVRLFAIGRLWRQVLAQAADFGVSRVSFHATPGRWRTGPATTLPVDVLEQSPARLIVPTDTDPQSNVARIGRVRERTTAEMAAFFSVLQNSPAGLSAETLVEHWRLLLAAGADELHLYHVGLASPSRLRVVQSALAHF